MATITKTLGIATAYGYAKSKGYTGTEEEFAQALADLAAISAEAETLEPDDEATASYSGGVLSFGIPKGEKGAQGNHALTANEAADMVDETAIYVYTGSETGYTFGHWYYYDGEEWADGGIYTNSDTDTTLSVAGMAADAKATGDEINELQPNLLTGSIKTLLMELFRHVVFADDANDIYQSLNNALFPAVTSLSATYSGTDTIYTYTDLNALKADLVVVATYSDTHTETLSPLSYTLSGTLTVGTSTITVTYGQVTTTFTVTVADDPVISIEAVYSGTKPIYNTDPLSIFDDDLVVTAEYDSGRTVIIPSDEYTLSGSLSGGSNTITVTYGSVSDTFTVNVHAFVVVSGYTMGVMSTPIRMKANSSRMVVADAYGTEYPIKYENGTDSIYFAMPIRQGVQRLVTTGYSDTQGYIGENYTVYSRDQSGELVRANDGDFTSARTYDLSNYNDGTYIMTIQLSDGTADISNWVFTFT